MWMPWAAAAFGLLFVAFFAFAIGTRMVPPDGDHYVRGWIFGPGIFFWFFMMFLVFGSFAGCSGGAAGIRTIGHGDIGAIHRDYRDRDDDERDWEEWHRRAHEKMDQSRRD
jgi:hypothetical protein